MLESADKADGTVLKTMPGGSGVEARPNDNAAGARDLAAIGFAYVLLVAFTVPFFMGDTLGYADAILQRRFTDFGHFGWYLLGYVASEALMPLTRLVVGPALHLNITFTLVAINIATGLLSVLLMYSLVYRLTRLRTAAYLATAAAAGARLPKRAEPGVPQLHAVGLLVYGGNGVSPAGNLVARAR